MWCPLRSGRKVQRPKHTASISRQLMWRQPFFSTKGPKPVYHRTALPNLRWKRLLRPPSFCIWYTRARPIPSTEGLSKGPELWRRPGSPWHGGIRDAKHGEELEVSASIEGSTCKAGPTELPGTGWPWSIFWNVLRGRDAPILNEAMSCWMASACSVATTTLSWAQSKTVPKNDIHWLGDSVLLAKLTLSPRHSKWLRRKKEGSVR